MVRHGGVDLPSQFDEASAEVVLLGLPGQVKRINRNAVSTQAGSGVEGMKAERLGRSRCDDFPNIQIHAQAEHLKLVDQRDVDAAVNILQQLGHLGRGGGGYGNRAMEDGTVQSASQLRGLGIQSAYDLGN